MTPSAVARAVVRHAEAETGIHASLIWGRDKHPETCAVRFACQWALRKGAEITTVRLGNLWGRDHSSISHGVGRASEIMAEDHEFEALCLELYRIADGGKPPKSKPAPKPRKIKESYAQKLWKRHLNADRNHVAALHRYFERRAAA